MMNMITMIISIILMNYNNQIMIIVMILMIIVTMIMMTWRLACSYRCIDDPDKDVLHFQFWFKMVFDHDNNDDDDDDHIMISINWSGWNGEFGLPHSSQSWTRAFSTEGPEK